MNWFCGAVSVRCCCFGVGGMILLLSINKLRHTKRGRGKAFCDSSAKGLVHKCLTEGGMGLKIVKICMMSFMNGPLKKANHINRLLRNANKNIFYETKFVQQALDLKKK